MFIAERKRCCSAGSDHQQRLCWTGQLCLVLLSHIKKITKKVQKQLKSSRLNWSQRFMPKWAKTKPQCSIIRAAPVKRYGYSPSTLFAFNISTFIIQKPWSVDVLLGCLDTNKKSYCTFLMKSVTSSDTLSICALHRYRLRCVKLKHSLDIRSGVFSHHGYGLAERRGKTLGSLKIDVILGIKRQCES